MTMTLWSGVRAHPALRAVLALALAGCVLLLSVDASRSLQRARSAGPTWLQAGLPGRLVHSIALGPEPLAFAGAHDGIYRRDGHGRWVRVLEAGDVWDVALLADGRTVLGADNDGYVDVSRDAGRHWHRTLLNIAGCYAVSAQPGHPQRLLAGAAGGVYLSSDGGSRWARRLALPGAAGAAIAWQPGSERVVYAGAVSGGASGSTLVYISRDAGSTWHVFGRQLNSTGGIMSLASTESSHVFAGTMGNAVWQASGPAGIWRKSARGMPPTNDHVAGFASLPGQPRVLFAGTLGHGVFRTDDGGRRWVDISGNLTSTLNTSIVLSLAYSPRDRLLYAGTSAGIYALPILPAMR